MRLDDEVTAWLEQRTAESGRSLSAEANAWLRRAGGLHPGQQTEAARRNQVASIGAAGGSGPTLRRGPQIHGP